MATREIPIPGCRSKLLSRVEVAEGTMAFHFEKPSQFDFKPGQSADLWGDEGRTQQARSNMSLQSKQWP